MSLNQNQFNQIPVQGMADQQAGFGSTPCRVKSDEATPLIPGQSVKRVNSAGGVPEVTACTADSDAVYGFVAYSTKNGTFAAGASVEIARGMLVNVMWMTAGAAFAPDTPLMVVIATKKVITATTGKPISGISFDKAAADGDLVRVEITCPALFIA